MDVFQITGGRKMEGRVEAQGAKNAVLPLLCACLLIGDEVTLLRCPDLTDVTAALEILTHLGCRVTRRAGEATVDAAGLSSCAVPDKLMRAMRSSVLFLGPLLARTGRAELSRPGGCEIGSRPIDLHLAAMRALGARVREEEGVLRCRASRLVGTEISLAFPSVGATENALLAACGAEGETTILNAAREPEITALQEFLNAMGGRVRGAGGSVISVEGGRALHGGSFTVPGDRIVGATLLCSAACAGGDVLVSGVDYRHLSAVTSMLTGAGCSVTSGPEGVRLRRDGTKRLFALPPVRTAPYPGFPTDAQPPMMAAAASAEGDTLFVENLFESRFRHVPELRRMGAAIEVEDRAAAVRGVEKLHGARVEARDLRGGGALTAAALGAEGTTILAGTGHIDRGYDHLEQMIQSLGGEMLRLRE